MSVNRTACWTLGLLLTGCNGALQATSDGAMPPGTTDAAMPDAAMSQAGDLATAPPNILPCNQLSAAGMWENITPGDVNLDPGFQTPAGTNYGAHSVGVDRQNSGTVYLGTSAQGIYKTTDCGATWAHINTGRNGDKLDSGRQWFFVVDPIDSQILYTNAGYGQNNAWKSTNGGVDWDPLVSDDYVKALQFGGFVHLVALDPTNHNHLVVTPHFECEVGAVNGLPKTKNCLLETMDAGATWTIREGKPPGGEGGGIWMDDSKLWFFSVGSDGLWRTGDGGDSWQHVYTGGYAGLGDWKLSNGKRYLGGVFNLLESSDDGANWDAIPGSPGVNFIAGTADTMLLVRDTSYYSASVSDLSTWNQLSSPPVPAGIQAWFIGYDPDHHVLYSVDGTAGFWRMVVK
jgi:hypothetical protein